MKREPELDAIYHELLQLYNQTMTMQDACRELHLKKPESVKELVPLGWFGAKKGLRIRTYSFARQLIALYPICWENRKETI